MHWQGREAIGGEKGAKEAGLILKALFPWGGMQNVVITRQHLTLEGLGSLGEQCLLPTPSISPFLFLKCTLWFPPTHTQWKEAEYSFLDFWLSNSQRSAGSPLRMNEVCSENIFVSPVCS